MGKGIQNTKKKVVPRVDEFRYCCTFCTFESFERSDIDYHFALYHKIAFYQRLLNIKE